MVERTVLSLDRTTRSLKAFTLQLFGPHHNIYRSHNLQYYFWIIKQVNKIYSYTHNYTHSPFLYSPHLSVLSRSIVHLNKSNIFKSVEITPLHSSLILFFLIRYIQDSCLTDTVRYSNVHLKRDLVYLSPFFILHLMLNHLFVYVYSCLCMCVCVRVYIYNTNNLF